MSVLAIDMGGTRIKVGIVHEERVVASDMIPAHSDRGLAQALPRVVSALNALRASTAASAGELTGVAMGFPGIVDRKARKVLATNGKYDDAKEIDLRAWAREAWQLPLHLENDARMAGIAEWRLGAGRGSDNLAVITLGTGIGVCIVMEGRVLRGQHGQAGILGGHLCLDPYGPVCGCGNRGCAEALASDHVIESLAKKNSRFSSSPLARAPRVNFQTVFSLAAQGDALAAHLIDHALAVWGALCVSLIHAYDLDRIVLGGGIMGAADRILPSLQSHVSRHAWTPWGHVEVRAGELLDHTALLASEYLLHEMP